MRIILLLLAGISVFCSACWALDEGNPVGRERAEDTFALRIPLLPAPQEWTFNEYWQPGRVGSRDFYFAEAGPYYRYSEDKIRMLEQVGLYDRMVPGHANLPKGLESFVPEVTETLTPPLRRLVRSYLDNRWPVLSLEFVTIKGNPPPSEAARKAVGDLWIGDGHPEQVYRLEPVLRYIRTGEKWHGSSQHHWKDEEVKNFMENRLFPILEKELPFFRDPLHRWTHRELRRLSEIYCEEFHRPVGRAVAWGAHLSPYHMASLPTTVTVGDKGANPLKVAQARGMMRQSGGNKFFVIWQAHGPTLRWAYFDSAWTTLKRDDWGYPLPLIRYYLFRPYLVGANYYHLEASPGSLVRDVEADSQYELSTLGWIARDMLDFVERHPDRGVPYAPVALLKEYTRQLPRGKARGTTYLGYNLPFDDADHMTAGVIRQLFRQHPHVGPSPGYDNVAPYGEIFDVLAPNPPSRNVDPTLLENYKLLFALGGVEVDEGYARALEDYVRAGGSVVINVEDIGDHLPGEFFGVRIGSGTARGDRVECALDGRTFQEKRFTFSLLELDGAEAIYTSGGHPIVTRHQVGEGHAILVAARYMIQDEANLVRKGRSRKTFESKPLLQFVPDFFDHLTFGLSPIEFRRSSENEEDLSWTISAKGDGWVVAVFNYSLERELVSSSRGTGNVKAEYPYRAIPFQIVAQTPVEDVLEWYDDRDVNWSRDGKTGRAVISESIRGGEIRVFELQPHRIQMGTRTRYVNHALEKPVRASSTHEGSAPELAVDGDLDNDRYWQSGTDVEGEGGRSRGRLAMPQWLEVDLGEAKTVDHVFVLFHTWPEQTLDSRLRVYKYVVEASENRKKWEVVVDESRNEDPARMHGLERWSDPVRARYIRLKVLRNSGLAGAQVVELKVMGPEHETFEPKRSKAP